jgi:hypothetical protein
MPVDLRQVLAVRRYVIPFEKEDVPAPAAHRTREMLVRCGEIVVAVVFVYSFFCFGALEVHR